MLDYTPVAEASSMPSVDLMVGGARVAPAQQAQAPLGTIAKLRTGFSSGSALQSSERRLLRFSLQSAARELLPRERVSKCLRFPIPAAGTVDVYRSPKFSTAHYGGLQVCASVWACPVCSAKITERRRIELAGGVQFWRSEAAGYLLLVTYTLRHHQGDSLDLLLSALLLAFENVHKGGWWSRFQAKYRIYGKVRALEVTHGASGWHPHIHVLYFLGSGPLPAVAGIEVGLKTRWLELLKKQGRDASWANGVDVRMSDKDIAEYLAKYGEEPNWKIEHEMTKTPSKIAKKGGRTAFQLLKDFSEGDTVSGRLFMQYVVNFKGKSQLHWSKGLRSLLHMDVELSDKEVATKLENDAILLAQLTRDQWRLVVGNDARAELLNIAARGDIDGLWSFLATLGGF